MELNIQILMNELEHVSAFRQEGDFLERRLSFYTVYQPECVLREDTLYLVETMGQAAEILEVEPGNAFICLEGQEEPEE